MVLAAAAQLRGTAPLSSSEKELRVCTTGDYPPLTSYDETTKEFLGFAPALLRRFGTLYNYNIKFVRTAWPVLAADLAVGSKCLLAAGGIAKTHARLAQFVVSADLFSDRKVPIFSKANAARFRRLADLNQANVTVLENAGGTNAEFVRELELNGILSRPSMKILQRNPDVFACLNKHTHRPLVMFTDQIEAQFRAGVNGSLLSDRGALFDFPGRLDPETHKVFLAQNTKEGQSVMAQLNRFLADSRASGHLDRLKADAFSASYPPELSSCPLKFD
eukprot:CAMPEP_0179017610 /NCGR_PEP_ID=MMETSP0796-20121207/3926_1 /TAXON_ID=73915 /ORGANISM="Pyrodinium bahamense, Strain pbaha01" /LENGTH=275 /DNA_ID=CAMNT_0020713341 /DNA_START=77 /DNA_END=904 /DNA_ORIENTATION=+